MRTYEQQLTLVNALPRASTDDDRHIDWCGTEDVLGLARTPNGRIELFLAGPELEARHHRVRAALDYQRWYRANGAQLLANRLLLPNAGHFEQVAAFLSTELLRNGIETNMAQAFARTEPLIELAIDELMIADETLLGLSGEIVVLHALAQAANDDRVAEVVDAWKGHRDVPRDFQLGHVGVEVKTTSALTSSHFFRGVHRLELGHGVDGVDEESYLLLSLGIERPGTDDTANTTSLPELVDGVLERIRDALGPPAASVVDELLRRLRDYGTPVSLGYDHRSMAKSARFSRRFRLTFVRGYDLADDGIRLLTTDDMRARPLIDAQALRARVNFPHQVRGDLNPVVGLTACAMRVLEGA